MLRWKAFNDLYGADWLRKRVSLGFPYSDYAAVYAADGNEVFAMAEVNRPAVAMRGGVETVGGLAYVCTRPSVSRMGMATKLLKDVISREEAAGMHWIFLLTARQLVAHSVYAKLGFTDVQLSIQSNGFRRTERGQKLPAGYTAATPEEKDLDSLDALRDEFAKGRFGFSARKKGHLSRWVGTGDLPLSNIVMVSRDGVPVAYAITRGQGGGSIGTFEMVAPRQEDRIPLLQALEARADGAWLVAGAVPQDVWEPQLAGRGYVITRDTWGGVLMAKPLGKELSASEIRHELGGDDPGFIMQLLDFF
jgi:GNAT superfamily N-acetyltransferase